LVPPVAEVQVLVPVVLAAGVQVLVPVVLAAGVEVQVHVVLAALAVEVEVLLLVPLAGCVGSHQTHTQPRPAAGESVSAPSCQTQPAEGLHLCSCVGDQLLHPSAGLACSPLVGVAAHEEML
jgi:hypothetical protein